jgi:hypothetical protein
VILAILALAVGLHFIDHQCIPTAQISESALDKSKSLTDAASHTTAGVFCRF